MFYCAVDMVENELTYRGFLITIHEYDLRKAVEKFASNARPSIEGRDAIRAFASLLTGRFPQVWQAPGTDFWVD